MLEHVGAVTRTNLLLAFSVRLGWYQLRLENALLLVDVTRSTNKRTRNIVTSTQVANSDRKLCMPMFLIIAPTHSNERVEWIEVMIGGSRSMLDHATRTNL